jgi:hypothetical protein
MKFRKQRLKGEYKSTDVAGYYVRHVADRQSREWIGYRVEFNGEPIGLVEYPEQGFALCEAHHKGAK